MNDTKERRAFTNFVIEEIGCYEAISGGNYCADLCEWLDKCKCVGACGSEQCIDKLIEFYGGEDYEDN